MNIPEDLRYSREHEWVRLTGSVARIGITDFAQDSLGDVVFVQLPDVGLDAVAGASVSEIESTKSVSDVYVPVTGVVSAVNEALADQPELVNQDPYGTGWMFELEVTDVSEVDALLDAAAYRSSSRAKLTRSSVAEPSTLTLLLRCRRPLSHPVRIASLTP